MICRTLILAALALVVAFGAWYVVEEDTIRAHDQTGVLPMNAKYEFVSIFRAK